MKLKGDIVANAIIVHALHGGKCPAFSFYSFEALILRDVAIESLNLSLPQRLFPILTFLNYQERLKFVISQTAHGPILSISAMQVNIDRISLFSLGLNHFSTATAMRQLEIRRCRWGRREP